MKLVDLRDLLLSTNIPCSHYFARKKEGNYIVWSEKGQGDSSFGDNRMVMQGIQGTIEYYTKDEFDSSADLIQQKLNSVDITWEIGSIIFNEKTEYIEYLWNWEMANDLESEEGFFGG